MYITFILMYFNKSQSRCGYEEGVGIEVVLTSMFILLVLTKQKKDNCSCKHKGNHYGFKLKIKSSKLSNANKDQVKIQLASSFLGHNLVKILFFLTFSIDLIIGTWLRYWSARNLMLKHLQHFRTIRPKGFFNTSIMINIKSNTLSRFILTMLIIQHKNVKTFQ